MPQVFHQQTQLRLPHGETHQSERHQEKVLGDQWWCERLLHLRSLRQRAQVTFRSRLSHQGNVGLRYYGIKIAFLKINFWQAQAIS